VFVRALCDVARGLDKQVIAEWVENQEVLKILTEMGVQYGQGFVFVTRSPSRHQLARTGRQPSSPDPPGFLPAFLRIFSAQNRPRMVFVSLMRPRRTSPAPRERQSQRLQKLALVELRALEFQLARQEKSMVSLEYPTQGCRRPSSRHSAAT